MPATQDAKQVLDALECDRLAVLHDEVAAFLAAKTELAETTENPWVIFSEAQLKGRYDSFESAYEYAVKHCESGRFIIRHVTEEQPFVPIATFPPEGRS